MEIMLTITGRVSWVCASAPGQDMEGSAFQQITGATFPVCWHLHVPLVSVIVTHSVQVLWQSFNHRVRVSVFINRKSKKAALPGLGEEVTLSISLQSRAPAACAWAGHLSPGKAAGSSPELR